MQSKTFVSQTTRPKSSIFGSKSHTKKFSMIRLPALMTFSQTRQAEPTASKSVHTLIEQRIKELKVSVQEDGDIPPLSASEESFFSFLSLFTITELPEITVTDEGCYYLRIVNGNYKLVVLFLADMSINYLIEDNDGYLENTSTIDFFKNQHSSFVREFIFNG